MGNPTLAACQLAKLCVDQGPVSFIGSYLSLGAHATAAHQSFGTALALVCTLTLSCVCVASSALAAARRWAFLHNSKVWSLRALLARLLTARVKTIVQRRACSPARSSGLRATVGSWGAEPYSGSKLAKVCVDQGPVSLMDNYLRPGAFATAAHQSFGTALALVRTLTLSRAFVASLTLATR
jgi:hypothetical protein